MAFNSDKLKCIYHANGVGLFLYTTTDNVADLDTAGYFNGAVDKLGVGSFIMAKAANGAGIYNVKENDGSAVDAYDVLAVPATDAD